MTTVKNSIYYFFAGPPASGGAFVSMDHIAALNKFGFDAKACFPAFNESLLKLGIPVAPNNTRISPDDIVVTNESDRVLLNQILAVPCTKIMHNQNPYYTFLGVNDVAQLNAFAFNRIIVPSDFCASRLAELGVTAPISRVRPALPDYFKPAPKRLQIAYSSNKRPYEAAFLKEYFRAQAPEYAHLPWLAISHMSRQEGAAIMAQSAVYAAFAFLESLGLMSLEAMASGCHVVGYTGFGGTEYATPENGDWVDEGGHQDFVAKLRAALQLHEAGKADAKIEAGRRTAAHFSHDGFEKELKAAWLSIMGENAHRYRKQ